MNNVTKLKLRKVIRKEILKELKSNKKSLTESMVMMSSLPAIGTITTLGRERKDNFLFKGLPQQFDKNGKKIYNENGDKIFEDFDEKYKQKAQQDYDELESIKKSLKKIMFSSKDYSESVFKTLRRLYFQFDKANKYLHDDAKLDSAVTDEE